MGYENPLQDGETSGGPGLGYENKLGRSIEVAWEIFKVITVIPKIIEVIRHNQQILDETGPKRTSDNKNDRRRRWLQSKGKR